MSLTYDLSRRSLQETPMRLANSIQALRVARAALLIGMLGMCATTSAFAADGTIRQWRLVKAANGYDLALKEVAQAKPAANQVAVRVHAVSLNRRDLLMKAGNYGLGSVQEGGVPISDGAGEVIAVGPGVKRFRVGDR